MSESTDPKDSAPPDRKGKDKKKHKDEKPKVKKSGRHFREEAQQAHEVPQIQEFKVDNQNDIIQADSGLSPSAIIEMFHLQDEENSSSVVAIARYLVENETSGDFYQARTKQRKQHANYPDHVLHRRSSLVKAQQKIRDSSTKAENSMCWSILQHDGEKTVVVMILGIVTGMCWIDALNLQSGNASSSSSDFDSLLCAYSAGSNRSRQNLFILFKYPSQ